MWRERQRFRPARSRPTNDVQEIIVNANRRGGSRWIIRLDGAYGGHRADRVRRTAITWNARRRSSASGADHRHGAGGAETVIGSNDADSIRGGGRRTTSCRAGAASDTYILMPPGDGND